MVWWDAGDEDEEIHGMRAGIGGENSKGDSAKAERRNAQKLLKSCQSHSWGSARPSEDTSNTTLSICQSVKAKTEVLAVYAKCVGGICKQCDKNLNPHTLELSETREWLNLAQKM